MEWVETTAATVEDASNRALDLLGVDTSDAEIEVLDEGKTGFFGRVKTEARVRARIKPKAAPAKEDRNRGGRRNDRNRGGSRDGGNRGGNRGGRNQGKGNRDGGNRGGGNRDGGNLTVVAPRLLLQVRRPWAAQPLPVAGAETTPPAATVAAVTVAVAIVMAVTGAMTAVATAADGRIATIARRPAWTRNSAPRIRKPHS